MSGTEATVLPRDCPYFGLDYYEEEWGAWFFGREADRDKIITNLRASRLTLLHANSGVGKSSLLRAGVVARLQELAHENSARRGSPRYVPVVFSSWKDDPIPPLISAIGEAIEPFLNGRPKPALPTQHLDQAIQQAADAVGGRLFILLDQFEEYFNYSAAEPTPERLAAEVARCINAPDLPANFLISIREDAYAGLGDLFKGRIANVYGNYLAIDYLDRQGAESAICKPIRVYNDQPGKEPVEIEAALVGAVLDQVGVHNEGSDPRTATGSEPDNGNGNGHVETPLLQLVMERVWKQEESTWKQAPLASPRALRKSTLDELKGVETIVDTHLGDALNALDEHERAVAVEVFRYLVTGSGGKIAESVPDLADRTGKSEAEVRNVLDKLDRERILRPVAAPPGKDPMRFRRYEIFHDVLAPAINRVIAASGEERLAREKEQADERARLERERAKRFRGLAAVALVLLLLAAAGLVLAFFEYRSAISGSHKLHASKLALAADLNAGRDPQLSAMLALRSLGIHNTQQGRAALTAALPQVQGLNTLQNGRAVNFAVFDPANSNEVASAGKDGVTWLWNVKSGRRLLRLWPAGGFAKNGAALSVAFSTDGHQVAVGYGLGGVAVYDARTGRQRSSTNLGQGVFAVAFDGPAGAVAITTSQGAQLWFPHRDPRCCFLPIAKGQGIQSVAVDPVNEAKFVVASESGTVLWNLQNPKHPVSQSVGLGNNDAQFNAQGTQIVTADSDGVVRIYDPSHGSEPPATLSVGEAGAVSAQFDPSGNRVVVAYTSGTTRVWDTQTDFPMTMLSGDTNAVNSAQFGANGREVVTASDDGSIRVWYAQPRELRYALVSSYGPGGMAREALTAQFGATNKLLVVDQSNPAWVFNGNGNPATPDHRRLEVGRGLTVTAAQFNRAGTRVVTADADGSVRLWAPSNSGYKPVKLPAPINVPGGAQYAAFSPDPAGSRLVVVTNAGSAEVWSDVTAKQLFPSLSPANGFTVTAAAFRPPAGQEVYTADADGQVEIWSGVTGHSLGTIGTTGGASITDLEFNLTGTELVTAAADGMVTVRSPSHPKQRPLRISACPTPSSASFSPNGKQIVVACGDGSIPIFDARTGVHLVDLKSAFDGAINDASFSPDGKSVVAAFGNRSAGGVEVWSTELATTSMRDLRKVATSRLSGRLTNGERAALNAASAG